MAWGLLLGSLGVTPRAPLTTYGSVALIHSIKPLNVKLEASKSKTLGFGDP